MTMRFSAPCAAGALLFFSGTAGAATRGILGLPEGWLIPALIALLCAAVTSGLCVLLVRRRRAKAASAVVVGARERSIQRHTERQRIATQFSELNY